MGRVLWAIEADSAHHLLQRPTRRSRRSGPPWGRRNGRDRHRGVALHRWRCTRSHRTHTGDGARAVVSAQTAFLDVGAGRAAPPRFYARVGGRCFRRRWPSGSNGTPAVHRRTIPDAPCARTRSKRVRGTPKTLFRPLGTPRARCGAILGRHPAGNVSATGFRSSQPRGSLRNSAPASSYGLEKTRTSSIDAAKGLLAA